MKFLVVGATGTVGSEVARELLGRGHQVRALTRHPEKARDLASKAEIVKGDLLDPATVRTLFQGMDGAYLAHPVSPTEGHEGLMAVSGAYVSKLSRLVYVSVQHADRAAYLPHFGCKVGIEAGIKSLGVSYTILRPSNFFQNDNWLREPLVQYGVYPQPIGNVGVSRVDVRDIAEAAAIALTVPGHEGKTYDLVGPRVLTGDETAGVWAKAFGRPIRYAGDDLEAWEREALKMMPAPAVYDFKLMYAHFQRHGLKGTSEDVATVTRVLGHPPRRFEDYAMEMAGAWTQSAAKA